MVNEMVRLVGMSESDTATDQYREATSMCQGEVAWAKVSLSLELMVLRWSLQKSRHRSCL